MRVDPAKYFRDSREWYKLLGEKGIVELVTKVEVTSPGLEEFLPYCFLIIKLENGKKYEVMGEARNIFEKGDKVMLELRKSAVPDEASVIPYNLKAVNI